MCAATHFCETVPFLRPQIICDCVWNIFLSFSDNKWLFVSFYWIISRRFRWSSGRRFLGGAAQSTRQGRGDRAQGVGGGMGRGASSTSTQVAQVKFCFVLRKVLTTLWKQEIFLLQTGALRGFDGTVQTLRISERLKKEIKFVGVLSFADTPAPLPPPNMWIPSRK